MIGRTVAILRAAGTRELASTWRYTGIGTWTSGMAKRVPLPPPGFDDLSVDKKMDDFQSLWDQIAATRAMVPVPAWYREVTDKRVTDLEADPSVTAGGCAGPSP